MSNFKKAKENAILSTLGGLIGAALCMTLAPIMAFHSNLPVSITTREIKIFGTIGYLIGSIGFSLATIYFLFQSFWDIKVVKRADVWFTKQSFGYKAVIGALFMVNGFFLGVFIGRYFIGYA